VAFFSRTPSLKLVQVISQQSVIHSPNINAESLIKGIKGFHGFSF